jgi:calpain-7
MAVITAADHLMKAMKLSSDPDEKRRLKSQCAEFLDMAERIKRTGEWASLVNPSTVNPSTASPSTVNPSTVNPSTENDKHEQIGQWVADVAVSADLTHTFRDTASHSSASCDRGAIAVPLTTQASANVSVPPVSLPIRGTNVNEPAHVYFQSPNNLPGNRLPQSHDSISMAPTGGQHNSGFQSGQRATDTVTPSTAGQSTPALASHRSSSATKAAVSSLSTASNSRIHRLREPVSTRKRSKKEEIILLKASRINGFKCPPWDKEPTSTEFVVQQGEELFT